VSRPIVLSLLLPLLLPAVAQAQGIELCGSIARTTADDMRIQESDLTIERASQAALELDTLPADSDDPVHLHGRSNRVRVMQGYVLRSSALSALEAHGASSAVTKRAANEFCSWLVAHGAWSD
jgi:hypothetical protein